MAKRRRRKKKKVTIKIKPETLNSVAAIVLFMLGILVVVSFTGQGTFLSLVNQYLATKLGWGMFFLPVVFLFSGLVTLQVDKAWSKPNVLLGTLLVMIGSVGVTRAGVIGGQTFDNIGQLISPVGAYIVFSTVLVIGVLIITQLSLKEIAELMVKLKPVPKEVAEEDEVGQETLVTDEEVTQARGFKVPKLSLFGKKDEDMGFTVNDNSSKVEETKTTEETTAVTPKSIDNLPKLESKRGEDGAASLSSDTDTQNVKPMVWEYPPLSLLSSKSGGEADRGDVKANASIIENTLDSFGIKAKVVEVNYGPSVTQYALEISRGTKLSKITGLSTDLALALAAPTGQIRIEAPIAGRSLVGIEVPNHSAQFVTLRTMLASKDMKNQKSKLAVALGINVAGKPAIADVAKMPHVLIAGATGSGKSVCINTIMCSILFRASPDEVKFILVDPKRVELTGYNDIPHLLAPVIVDPSKVVSSLKWATAEMDKRYKKLAEVGVKNIASYNELAGFAAMPAIVIVIDEMADVMMFAPGDVEECITRLAQMARAVGIHLVLATQRPSVDVITGLIKANIPTRAAFNVSSMQDSRVILDMPGAEKLLGKGDMLFIPPDQAKPSRIQGTYVSDTEAKALIDFIKSQGQKPQYEEEITTKFKASSVSGGSSGTDGSERDSKFDDAVRLISKYDKASSSLIQRRLSVGYARAARILDQLFEAGLVTPPDGSKPRDVNMAKLREYLAQQAGGET
jgi:S-DNA-T family DNA segregation ATPase FtsK/SpoIIIE